MKYNEKYDRYVTKGGLVYRYDSKQDKLILCKLSTDKDGYLTLMVSKPKRTPIKVHRLVYETFNGEISKGLQIDHINTIKDDNRIENLKLCTPKENSNNPLSKKHISESKKGQCWSDFGKKFKEYFGISRYENVRLYKREQRWYFTHNHECRWE